MKNILFLNNQKIVNGKVKRLSEHLVQLTGVEQNLGGFEVLTPKGKIFGKFHDFTTLYRETEDGFILSNDGSVYVEVVPTPDPKPYEPTLEEVKKMKISEMNAAQQKMICEGVNVVLVDGTTEHFTLTAHDQTCLMGLRNQVMSGEERLAWHTSNEEEHSKFYSNKDMDTITLAALNYLIWHTTYLQDLRIYIYSLDSKEAVKNVAYGMNIPEEFQSEVWKAMSVAGK